jgi:hypothetical protein
VANRVRPTRSIADRVTGPGAGSAGPRKLRPNPTTERFLVWLKSTFARHSRRNCGRWPGTSDFHPIRQPFVARLAGHRQSHGIACEHGAVGPKRRPPGASHPGGRTGLAYYARSGACRHRPTGLTSPTTLLHTTLPQPRPAAGLTRGGGAAPRNRGTAEPQNRGTAEPRNRRSEH